jgi:hypothetical protein
MTAPPGFCDYSTDCYCDCSTTVSPTTPPTASPVSVQFLHFLAGILGLFGIFSLFLWLCGCYVTAPPTTILRLLMLLLLLPPVSPTIPFRSLACPPPPTPFGHFLAPFHPPFRSPFCPLALFSCSCRSPALVHISPLLYPLSLPFKTLALHRHFRTIRPASCYVALGPFLSCDPIHPQELRTAVVGAFAFGPAVFSGP